MPPPRQVHHKEPGVQGHGHRDQHGGEICGAYSQHLQRYGGHKQDFSKSENRIKSTLAGHIWNLKDKNEEPKINWEVVCRAAPFSPTTGVCNLCTSEKWHIIFKPETATLNRRQELFNHCRHKEKLLIVKKSRRLRNNGS